MKYCQYCGTQIGEDAKFCPHCGKAVWHAATAEAGAPKEDRAVLEDRLLVEKLSSRLKTNGIVWLVIAAIQLLIGLLGAWYVLFVGALNIFSAIMDIKNSKRILTDQNGIVKLHEPLVGPIVTLVYNLFVGGLIGVLGSIYYLVFVRGFVMENKTRFLAMESRPAWNGPVPCAPDEAPIEVGTELTAEEAANGVRKEILVPGKTAPLYVSFPQGLTDGSTVLLRDVEFLLPNGETVKRNVHVRVRIRGEH